MPTERKWILTALLILTVAVINASAKKFHSCKQLKKAGRYGNGLYTIHTNIGKLEVYCEMKAFGGGFTFIPKQALKNGKLNLRNIFTDKRHVLLRLRNKHGAQTNTLIEPYINHPMSVLVGSYSGYTRPMNIPLGEYLYLGVVPANIANRRDTQGFISNGKHITFHNCDGNPNSYFAFFPNYHYYRPSQYNAKNLVYERRGVAVEWRKTGKRATDRVPHRFFYLTELHFGGCGTYTSSDRWSDATGTAIGLR